MKTNRLLMAVLLFLFSLNACCVIGKNLFVLLPDPDGRTGKIRVFNQGGDRLLTEPRQATEVKDTLIIPSPPMVMDEAEIEFLFGVALAAQPEPPLHYLLYFQEGATLLTEDSQKLIPEILAEVSARRITEVAIVGHTDRIGSQEENFKLGFNRARTVKDLLIGRGVNEQILEVVSHGEDNPLIHTPDEVAEPRNRRVEIILR